MGKKLYFMRDARTIVGNSVSWWAINGRGYTCDIRTAQIFTEDEIKVRRSTDIPYPIEDVIPLVQHHIDIQDLHAEPKRLRSWKMDELKRLTADEAPPIAQPAPTNETKKGET